MSKVCCRRRIAAKEKCKIYKLVERPATIYYLQVVALRIRQKAKALRFSLRVTRMDGIRNEFIRRAAQVERFREKVREARLRWFGHLQRRNSNTHYSSSEQRLVHILVVEKTAGYEVIRHNLDVVKSDI